MNNLNAWTDRLVIDQEDYLREARQRTLARKVKAAHGSKEQRVRRYRGSTRPA